MRPPIDEFDLLVGIALLIVSLEIARDRPVERLAVLSIGWTLYLAGKWRSGSGDE